MRQLGYLMLYKPDDEALEGFVLHGLGANDPDMLKGIIHSWEKVHKKGRELGKKNIMAKKPHTKERVQQIKLSFIFEPLNHPDSTNPVHISIEEVNELKATSFRLKQEK